MRISLMIVAAVALLLVTAQTIVCIYAYRAIKEQALQRTQQTVESTVQHIDNILLVVEQTAGNVYWDLMRQKHTPERMFYYCRRLMSTTPYIRGATIALKPFYFGEKTPLFMSYVHRPYAMADSVSLMGTDSLIEATVFGNRPYTEQTWYTEPLSHGTPCWVNPLKDENSEGGPIITYSLPIYENNQPVGVLAVDVSLALLSNIVLDAKPSPNSYATMLAGDGSFIIHPDSTKLYHHSIFSLKHSETNPSVLEAAREMLAGHTGNKLFSLHGRECYVFYKPFKRAEVPWRVQQDLGWSLGMVYPAADIFNRYYYLFAIIVVIFVASMLLLLLLSRRFTHRQLVPLRQLAHSAQRIADGHYHDILPQTALPSLRGGLLAGKDEIDRLTENFRQMQQSLATHMGELERLTTSLKERGEVLSQAYERAKEGDRMKTDFLHNVSDRMIPAVQSIDDLVGRLCTDDDKLTAEQISDLVRQVEQHGKDVANLINEILKESA